MAEMTALAKDAAYPPLPEGLPDSSRRAPSGKPLLADGCYYIVHGFGDMPFYHGTMRVEARAGELFASGDLYRLPEANAESPPVGMSPPPGTGVPIFPIATYAYYLRVVSITPAEGGFDLVFEAHQFVAEPITNLQGVPAPHWIAEQPHYTARMQPAEAPAGYPSPESFFVGDVTVPAPGVVDRTVARIQMGWVSPVLRRAVIEIDRVTGSEAPEHNGAGVTWKSIFDSLRWEVTTIVGQDYVTKKDDGPWTDADARAALAVYRDSADLDTEWRYHILVVPLMKSASNLGHMYDRGTRAREDLFMSSHFVLPADEAKWGPLRGVRNVKTVAFFRTAVHEMGHEMGLVHNETGFHFMRQTADIADHAPADTPFPSNIAWSFDPADEHRLRHWPDIAVRPGGIDQGGGIDAPAASSPKSGEASHG